MSFFHRLPVILLWLCVPTSLASFQAHSRCGLPTSGARASKSQPALNNLGQDYLSPWPSMRRNRNPSRISSVGPFPRSHRRSSAHRQYAFISPALSFATFDAFAKANPYAAAFLSCAWNGFMADCVAQRSERFQAQRQQQMLPPNGSATAVAVTIPHPSHNWRRTLAFILYGGCYQGASLHFIYNDLFLRWFGPGNALLKTAVSQLIMAPFLTLPVAYMFKGLVFGKTPREAISDYYIGLTQKGLLFSFWKLWVPIQFLVFTVIPPHLRMPFSSFFSFVWTVLLSRISNSK